MSDNLAVIDTGLNDLAFATNSGFGPEPGDEKLLVRFTDLIFENAQRTREEGRPIFEEKCFIEIMSPGEPFPYREMVNERFKERFPKQWEAYQHRKTDVLVDGTPLTEWSGMARTAAEELKYFNIYTVEQLAAVPDNNLNNMRGLSMLREKAQKFMEYADKQAAANAAAEAQKREAEKEERINTLEQDLAKALAALEALQEAPPKRKRATKAAQE